MEEIRSFYQTLYKTEYTDKEQINEGIQAIDNRLEENDKINLNKNISTEEINNAFKQMNNNNKSPGDVGLSKKNYVTFRDTLVEEIANTLWSGELPTS